MFFTDIFCHLFKIPLVLYGFFSLSSLNKKIYIYISPCCSYYSTFLPKFIQQLVFTIKNQNLVFHHRFQLHICECRQEGEMKPPCWFVCFSCVLSGWCSAWRSVSLLCFRSLPEAKTVEPLCLPTDISEFILFCLCRGYNSNDRWRGKKSSDQVISLCA